MTPAQASFEEYRRSMQLHLTVAHRAAENMAKLVAREPTVLTGFFETVPVNDQQGSGPRHFPFLLEDVSYHVEVLRRERDQVTSIRREA